MTEDTNHDPIDAPEGCKHENLRISITAPIHTVSEMNMREHWHKAGKRHTLQKMTLKTYWPATEVNLPCTIVLTRYGPRKLDEHDNLKTAFKYIVDWIAAKLLKHDKQGKGDNDPRFTWEYRQETCRKYAIKVQIYEN